MGDPFIPVNVPVLAASERDRLIECIDTGWISSEGPYVREFEERCAAAVGRAHAVAVSSGTAALDVAVAALGLGKGDEVVMPTFAIISCIQQVVRSGATPVLVDSDPLTWNMDVSLTLERLSPRTKAILVVHTYGLPVDMAPILDAARERGIAVIEDAAEMIGQTCRGSPCGSFGEVSTFSFYPNKHVTTGEGGMVLTDDERIARSAAELRNLCFQPGRRFVHERLGWNYRMTNLQAAVGVAQLERLQESVKRKRHIGRRYDALLADLPGVQLPLPRTEYADNVYWVYGLVLQDEVPFDAEQAMARLAGAGIGCRPFFWPMHEQPVFQRAGLFAGERYPVAERLARRGFYIPSGLGLTDADADRVAGALNDLLGR